MWQNDIIFTPAATDALINIIEMDNQLRQLLNLYGQ